jgi:hypothetical protein
MTNLPRPKLKLQWDKQRFIVGFSFALLAFGLSYLYQSNKDIFFERKWTEGVGRFVEAMDYELQKKAEEYIQTNGARKDELCVSEWIGKDEQYLYLGVGCAKFQQQLGDISAEGDQNFHPTRVRYDGQEVEHYQQPDAENEKSAVRDLFPRKAYDLFRLKAHQEKFFKRGWEKTLSLQK